METNHDETVPPALLDYRQDACATAAAIAIDPAELRARWRRTHQVISELLEQEGEHDPRVWEQGAYQLWLWLVVELLVVRRDDIGIDDLSAVSKMLHDQRKLSLDQDKQRAKGDKQGNGCAGPPRLPEHFGELVRQIYGTNFQDDASGKSATPTGSRAG